MFNALNAAAVGSNLENRQNLKTNLKPQRPRFLLRLHTVKGYRCTWSPYHVKTRQQLYFKAYPGT